VIVNDLDLLRPGFRPDKADPELVIDSDAVLAMAVPPERFQAIARWDLQIVEASSGVEDGELAERHTSEASKAAPGFPFKEGLGVSATKRPDQTLTLPPLDVGTQGGGIGRWRSRAVMAAWLTCVPPSYKFHPPSHPAPAQDVARRILGEDVTQIDNYTERVKRMVGKVLTGNGITRCEKGSYALVGGDELSDAERDQLLELCRQRLDAFREQRGEAVFAHRSRHRTPISGSVKYRVLTRARGRCECCGA